MSSQPTAPAFDLVSACSGSIAPSSEEQWKCTAVDSIHALSVLRGSST